MQGILNSFKFFIDIFKTLVDFLMYIIKSLIMMFRILGSVIEIPLSYMAHLPWWLASFFSASLIVSVLYIVLGRNGGKSD